MCCRAAIRTMTAKGQCTKILLVRDVLIGDQEYIEVAGGDL